ncbi:YqaA family protein [Idiomarina sp. HP20-50]|uniref:YqaA family protein n=1 Tax=Idiomarina sp. HP20-50 TaxID=3070813 RepID=UPI00294B18D8|nr:VTT domain-containing protein [Idiomarina sp. HP20-50]MDV6316764.1 VTT domain-containing protein [Idiomarina sp. HP20-50]
MKENTKTQQWYQKLASSPHALILLFFLSALEATVLPIALELILIPYMVLERNRIWLISTVALAGFLVGSVAGYYIGSALFDTAGQWFINYLSLQDYYQEFQQTLKQDGFTAIFLVGVTPVPFQVAMLAAGAGDYPLSLFLFAAGIARALRYYVLALIVIWLGPYTERLWGKYAGPVGWSILILAGSMLLLMQFL